MLLRVITYLHEKAKRPLSVDSSKIFQEKQIRKNIQEKIFNRQMSFWLCISLFNKLGECINLSNISFKKR